LTRPNKKTSTNHIRCAPSFKRFTKKDVSTTSCSHPYTVDALVEFLGWSTHKIEAVLNTLTAVEEGLLPDTGFEPQVPKNPGMGEQGIPGPLTGVPQGG
jgi:hypothetical protein